MSGVASDLYNGGEIAVFLHLLISCPVLNGFCQEYNFVDSQTATVAGDKLGSSASRLIPATVDVLFDHRARSIATPIMWGIATTRPPMKES
jgi:hypothetical protein